MTATGFDRRVFYEPSALTDTLSDVLVERSDHSFVIGCLYDKKVQFGPMPQGDYMVCHVDHIVRTVFFTEAGVQKFIPFEACRMMRIKLTPERMTELLQRVRCDLAFVNPSISKVAIDTILTSMNLAC